jgi:AcrR family transcriptional regulator
MNIERHVAVGGRVNLYRRSTSRFWQCQSTINGKSARVSTREENIEEARRFAENWYLSRISDEPDTDELSASIRKERASAHSLPFNLPVRDKRSRLLSAAIHVVSQVGFREAQITTIAERAGLAPATFYRYFTSRNELLVQVVDHVAQHEVNVVAGIAMGENAPSELLRQCIETFALRAIGGRQLAHALVAEPVESEIEIARLKHRRHLMRVFETVIDRGIKSGDFMLQTAEVSAACIVGSIFEALVGPLARDVDIPETQRLEQVKEIAAFCCRAIRGDAGDRGTRLST